MLQNAAQTYRSNQVTTATPADLTLMLYEGALKFIKQAKGSIQENRIEQANEYCIKVQNILYELMSTLNRDFPISQEFHKMYDYMFRRMIQANIKKDIAILDEVGDLFVQFRDTWRELMLLTKNKGNK